MTELHRLEPEVFDRLAGGGGGVAGIAALRAAQVSKHLLLIGHLLRRWPGDPAQRDAVAEALERARRASGEQFHRVIGAPLVGAWAAIVARALEQGLASHDDFAHLASIAMVACAACGVDGAAEVAVRDGVTVLPGLGAAIIPGTAASVTVENGQIRVRGGGATVEASNRESPYWRPLRHLVGAHGEHALGERALGEHPDGGYRIRVALDDLDPYRHGHHAPPALRLAPAEVDRWQELFAGAWRLLAQRLPERAAELAAGLGSLVPLRADGHSARSATLRHAFGVFGLTRPPSAAEFAVTLVHEFQHSKLSAMLEFESFSDPDDQRRYFAPWRTDPRPLAGLLQGVYAFVGVADTWRALRDVDGIAATAEARFAEARLQVDRGLRALEESSALTPAGAALGARLRRTTDAMLAEPVPREVARAAARTLDRTRQAWIDRNGTVD